MSRKLNSGNVDRACSTEEENLAGWAVARVTHVVSLVLFCQQQVMEIVIDLCDMWRVDG